MKFTIFLLISLSVLFALSSAKIYTECELAKELSNVFHMEYEEIQHWVCLAKRSDLDTSKKSSGLEGLNYHGLFLISARYWCSHGTHRPEANYCNVKCSDLRSDDITASVNCAKQIYKGSNNSYERWGSAAKNCEKRLPDLRKCFELL